MQFIWGRGMEPYTGKFISKGEMRPDLCFTRKIKTIKIRFNLSVNLNINNHTSVHDPASSTNPYFALQLV